MTAQIPFVSFSTFFASRERVRLPEALLLIDAMKKLGGTECSLSMRCAGRFAIGAQSASPQLSEDDVVEIADYDPVRHSVLAIGLKEPSLDTPLHWLSYRTDPASGAIAFVRFDGRKEGVAYVGKRHPFGTFDEAMEVVKLAKEKGAPAGVEGRGYLLRAGTLDKLVKILNGKNTGVIS